MGRLSKSGKVLSNKKMRIAQLRAGIKGEGTYTGKASLQQRYLEKIRKINNG